MCTCRCSTWGYYIFFLPHTVTWNEQTQIGKSKAQKYNSYFGSAYYGQHIIKRFYHLLYDVK